MKQHLITACLLLPGTALLALFGYEFSGWQGALMIPLVALFLLGDGITKILCLNPIYANWKRKTLHRDRVRERINRIKAARKRRIFWEKWEARFPTRHITEQQIQRRNQLQSDFVGGLFIAFYGSIFFWMGGKEFLLIYAAIVIVMLGHQERPRQNHW